MLQSSTAFYCFDYYIIFAAVNIWMCNGPNPGWETAVSKFSTSLRPAETKVAEKLKPRLHNMSTKQVGILCTY